MKSLFTPQVLIAYSTIIGSIALYHHKYVAVAFALASLLLEVNSVFLHLRKILLMNGYEKNSSIFKVNGVILLLTFVNFRLLTSAWMTNFVVTVARHVIPLWHYVFALVGLAIIPAFNIEFLMILCKSDFRHDQKSRN